MNMRTYSQCILLDYQIQYARRTFPTALDSHIHLHRIIDTALTLHQSRLPAVYISLQRLSLWMEVSR